jgi:hypothetical protein
MEKNTRYGDIIRTIIRSFRDGGKNLSPEFLDEIQRVFNELDERLAKLEKQQQEQKE